MSAYRIEKVNTLIQSLLAEHIEKEFCFSREVIICVTRVETTGNMQESKVYISAYPTQNRATAVKGLNRQIMIFQKKLNKDLRIRPVPRIIFVEDEKPEIAQEVETILEHIKEGDKH